MRHIQTRKYAEYKKSNILQQAYDLIKSNDIHIDLYRGASPEEMVHIVDKGGLPGGKYFTPEIYYATEYSGPHGYALSVSVPLANIEEVKYVLKQEYGDVGEHDHPLYLDDRIKDIQDPKDIVRKIQDEIKSSHLGFAEWYVGEYGGTYDTESGNFELEDGDWLADTELIVGSPIPIASIKEVSNNNKTMTIQEAYQQAKTFITREGLGEQSVRFQNNAWTDKDFPWLQNEQSENTESTQPDYSPPSPPRTWSV